MKVFLTFAFFFFFNLSLIHTKSTLTLDAFFNYTNIDGISLSTSGEYLLVETTNPSWDTHSYEHHLWLYQINERRKYLITNQLSPSVAFQWSPSGKLVAFLMQNSSANHVDFRYPSRINLNSMQNIYTYNVETNQLKSISVGNDIITALSWSENDSSLYYVALNLNSNNDDEEKWKDVIRYRAEYNSTIRQIDVNSMLPIRKDIVSVPFLVTELVFSSITKKLIFSSTPAILENADHMQIFSIDLNNTASIVKLTSDTSMKVGLSLINDQKSVVFVTMPFGSPDGTQNLTQNRLYSVDLTSKSIERWASDFQGNVQGYTTNGNNGVYILGQVGIQAQIYSQLSPKDQTVLHAGLTGTYLSITASTNSIAFVFTSFSKACEVYFTKDITQLKSATQITFDNTQYDQMDLPQAKAYQWTNRDDNQIIEGILYYPPGKFEQKSLPVLVLIHGGPTEASLNWFMGGWYFWAPLAATEGWLVFQPNYRGSIGYGDEFTNALRYQPVSIPQKDILDGVDQLIADGIADRTKLAIGGYSYGGILTNWIITQTTRFNAALSGAGSVEQASFWGTTDIPIYIADLVGSVPWTMPKLYQNQSAIYYVDRVRTPTHIVAGTADVRVPFSQSLMLARSLNYLGIPVKLQLLPNEGHTLPIDPWHGKAKVQEEIEWLKLYGYNSTIV